MTTYKRRRLADVRRAGVYTRVRAIDDPNKCVYCGNARGSTWDHVFPVASAATLRDLEITDPDIENMKIMVRACQQCNSTAGSRIFKSFDHKRAFIRDTLRRRYGDHRVGDAPGLPCVSRPLRVEAEQLAA